MGLRLLLPFICLWLISLALVRWILTFGMQLYSGGDAGVLVNAAWLEYHGAVPYRDFFMGAPPLFFLPAGWAFDLWGPTWLSLVKLTCVFSVVTFLWCAGVIWDGTKSVWSAIFFAVLLQAIVVLPGTWWWYNEITWMGCVIFFGSTLSLLCQPQPTIFSKVSFFLSGCALGLLKVNMAGILILGVVLVLAFNKRFRGFVALAGLGVLLVDVLFLLVNQINPFDVLSNYQALSGRLSLKMFVHLASVPDEFDNGWQFRALPILTVCIFLAIYLHRWTDLELKRYFYAMLAIAAALAVACTIMNYQRKALSSACLVMMLPYLYPQIRSSHRVAIKVVAGLSAYIVLALGYVGFQVGMGREMYCYFGMYSYTTPPCRILLSSPPLFDGMRVTPQNFSTLKAIKAALVQFKVIDLKRSVFFGPQIDFSYAAFNLTSPKDLPLCWEQVPSTHRGDSYPFDDFLPDYCNEPAHWILPGEPLNPHVQRFLDDKFDVCMFLNTRRRIPIMSYLPGDIRADIYENYDLHQSQLISVFVRRSGVH